MLNQINISAETAELRLRRFFALALPQKYFAHRKKLRLYVGKHLVNTGEICKIIKDLDGYKIDREGPEKCRIF